MAFHIRASLLSCLLFLPSALAQQHFTIEQVMSAPFASHLVAAPKGDSVAWILNEQGKRNVWVASAPDWKGRSLTSFDKDDGQEIDELCWMPDGQGLLFTRGGDFETGGSHPNPALSPQKPEQAIWLAGLVGTAAPKKLVDGSGSAASPDGASIAFLREGAIFLMAPDGGNVRSAVYEKGAADLQWSPDGSTLAFVSSRRSHSFVGLYQLQAKTLRYLDPSVDRDEHPEWSPDSKQIAYVRSAAHTRPFAFGPEREGEPWSLRVTDIAKGKSHVLFRATSGRGSLFHGLASQRQLFWTADNRIVFPSEHTGWCHLYTVDAGTSAEAMELTSGDGEVEFAAMSPDRSRILYSSNIGDIDRRHINELRLNETRPVPAPVTSGDGIEVEPAYVEGGSKQAFLQSSYNDTIHAAMRGSNGSIRALAPQSVPAEFPRTQLVRPQATLFSAADGLTIHGQIFEPHRVAAGRNGDKRPALIFFHGGSRRQMLLGFHYLYYYSNAYSLEQFFANQGYLVLSVNYRSGIGYGLDFREATQYGATGASEYNDVVGAALYLKARPDVDPQRVGVWGGSYGGYLTALALARGGSLFAAGVDFHGVHDWNLEIENFVPAYDPKAQADAAKIAWDSSPLSAVDGWRSPVLLIHGDDDRNVPFAETVQLTEALRQRHIHLEELIFPNEVHDFLLHEHWVQGYEAAADFFARQIPVEKK